MQADRVAMNAAGRLVRPDFTPLPSGNAEQKLIGGKLDGSGEGLGTEALGDGRCVRVGRLLGSRPEQILAETADPRLVGGFSRTGALVEFVLVEQLPQEPRQRRK